MKTNIVRRSQTSSKFSISQLNLFLIAIALMFLVLYIFNINKVAVLEYSLSATKSKIAKLNALNESLAENEDVDVSGLLAVAREKNMVEVKNYETFFQEVGVALTDDQFSSNH